MNHSSSAKTERVCTFLVVTSGKPVGEVEAHLVPEDAAGAGAGAVGLLDALVEDPAEEVEVACMGQTYPWRPPFPCQTPGVLLGLTAALLAAAIFGCVAVAQAAVVRATPALLAPDGCGAAAYLVGWLLHLVAIDRLPLYLAQVGVGASLDGHRAASPRSSMGEPLASRHWVAVVAMAGGLTLLAVSAGDVGNAEFADTTTVALYAVLGRQRAAGPARLALGRPASGVALGILAGTAYGGSPVATRSLVDPTLDVHTIAPALTIGLFGALGFVLYSAAMKRASVTAATAPVVLLSTVIPAAVGLVSFGDQVRVGWWPPAVIAFARQRRSRSRALRRGGARRPSAVVVQHQRVAGRPGLAGEHVPTLDLLGSSAQFASIVTVPWVRCARQVPQTPPLQAYGASPRTRNRASRTCSPGCTVKVGAAGRRASPSPGAGRRRSERGRDRRRLGVEQLGVDRPGSTPSMTSASCTVGDQVERPAQEPPVRVAEQRRAEPAESSYVEPPGQQLALLHLAAQQVHQLEPGRVAVLQVGELVEEHHVALGAVAVDQTDLVDVRVGQRQRHHGQHRRDAGAGSHERRSAQAASGSPNRPIGVITSRCRRPRASSPDFSERTSPREGQFTPIRRHGAPGSTHIEYDRRISSPAD